MATPKNFTGFDPPAQNWFRMPNEWIELCAEINSLAEMKVVQYVMRHTWGHQEYGIRKRISVDEFMNGRRRVDGERMDRGTGLSKPSVIAGLRSAVERGLLIEEVDDSDRARVKKYYALRMNPETVVAEESSDETDEEPSQEGEKSPEERGVKHLNAGVKILYPEVKKVYPRGQNSLPRTKKETLERNNKKENNNNMQSMQHTSAEAVVVALHSRGIAKRVAEELGQHFAPTYIEEKIAFHDFLVAERPTDIKKPAAWLRSAIENDYSAPDGLVSAADREMMANEEKRQKQAVLEAQEAHLQATLAAEREAEERYKQRLLYLHEKYQTQPAALAFWKQVLDEAKATLSAANFALIADAYILTLTKETAQVGITSSFKRSQLDHPGVRSQLNRIATHAAKRGINLEFVLLEELPA